MRISFEAAYLDLLRSGELQRRAIAAHEHLAVCDVCARACRVNRLEGELGNCRTGRWARVSSYGPHLGEEEPLRGWQGSGTIFFTRCNLHCQYCQNWEISQSSAGEEMSTEELAGVMLELQAYGCHNINFVSPSHVVPQIIAAVLLAAQSGLRLPLVYNSGGYDSPEMLDLLDGVIDIYMPDMKYGESETAKRYSLVDDYVEINHKAVRAMHRQVGDLQMDEHGLAQRGLLVRHLLLPNNQAGTAQVVHFLAGEISKDTYLNLMDQYRPEYLAGRYPELSRRISPQEYTEALELARQAGLRRLAG